MRRATLQSSKSLHRVLREEIIIRKEVTIDFELVTFLIPPNLVRPGLKLFDFTSE
jgi:hypothetical protein